MMGARPPLDAESGARVTSRRTAVVSCAAIGSAPTAKSMAMPISQRLPTAPLHAPLTAPRSRSEPPLEADEEPDWLPVGYCFREIDADPPGVGAHAEVGLPLVE